MSRGLRLGVTLFASVTSLLVVAAASAWYSHKYVAGATFIPWEYGYTPGYASREFNKVWRPAGYKFYLAYYHKNTGYGPLVFDTWSNPFVDNRNAFLAQAECGNWTNNQVDPVTCLTTVP